MSMTSEQAYRLQFDRDALRDWNALDGSVKAIFKKHLAKRLIAPHVHSDALHGDLQNCYKIKLRKQGYRLVYRVEDGKLIVIVIAIGRRDKSAVYEAATRRLKQS
jgi:mRNA interferase RelE/StbE